MLTPDQVEAELRQIGDERYQRRLDLNIDGIVDDLDLALFSKTFSRSSL